jgi:sugar phosphate isomerase/epimerase
MIKPAFSTVACPEWTLDRVARAAHEYGFEQVELRTFGAASRDISCEPAHTAPEKTRENFGGVGVELACLGTSVRFDEPISPPVIGRIFGDFERPVRAAKSAIDLAAQLECPLVRVFLFEHSRREPRKSAVARISERLRLAADGARNTGVRLVIENGGSFSTAVDLAEFIDRLNDPLVGAAYSMPVAFAAGEDPAAGVKVLGNRLWCARIRDFKGRTPCLLGEGDMPCREFIAALAGAGFDGPLVYEWDRLWLPELPAPEAALPVAAEQMFDWISSAMGVRAETSPARPYHL